MMRTLHLLARATWVFSLIRIACSLSTNNYSNDGMFQKARVEVLNLLNHPLQLQLATGDLNYGAFQRLLLDRTAILEGLELATGGLPEIKKEILLHKAESASWLRTAEQAGKTISLPDIQCYSCGKDHLNIDCPEDQIISSSAQALKSLLLSNGLGGATAVLQCYGFCCKTLLKACQLVADDRDELKIHSVYHGWLNVHAERWSELGAICGSKLSCSEEEEAAYTVCLSMVYNWIDTEASNTGIRADLKDPTLSAIMNELEWLEPGYTAQRDRHQSFVADLGGVQTGKIRKKEALSKIDKAAAYLAAKKGNNKNTKLDAAAAYLAAKKKKEEQ